MTRVTRLVCTAVLAAGCSAQDKTTTGGGLFSPVITDAGAGAKDAGSPSWSGYIPGSMTGNGSGSPDAAAGNGSFGPAESLIDDCGANNPAGLAPDLVMRLKAGGATTGMRWLYPYDGTVFPRGLAAPMLMWEGAADAVYVHLKSSTFEYHGCLKPSADGQLPLSEKVWHDAGAKTLGPSDPFLLELTTLKGSTVAGPISQKLVIAQATLSGSIYYNSYNSKTASGGLGGLGLGLGGGNGAVLRIKPGQNAELFVRQDHCTGCHSVSANGSRLVSNEISSFLAQGQVYAIGPDTAANPPPKIAAPVSAFVGLSPDGSVFVSSGARNNVGPPLNGGLPTVSDADATMYETDTGNVVSGTGIPVTALMPTFSPDASLLVFNDYAVKSGHALVLMDYDSKARKAANARTLYSDDNAFLGWPFVLPDNRAVIFAYGQSSMFNGDGVGINVSVGSGPSSDLAMVDVASGHATVLAQAMGFRTAADVQSGTTYLPFGNEELHQVYYPTVSPVASGGYFWVFFDSIRHYGNQGSHRQLWGTALTIAADGKYTSDPSHPAFYVGGQELDSANHRAFTALDPCVQDGQSCKSGIDCCGGRCEIPMDAEFGTEGTCNSKMNTCSKIDERCSTNTDCCPQPDGSPPLQCIAGFCAVVTVL